MWIFIAFLLVPIIEIGLFIQVGGLIGLWPTLLIVILTAIIGTSLVRSQGAQAMADLRGSMAELRDPMAPLAHGAMILLAGALLVTPGFFTDTCGMLLLIPKVRLWVMKEFGKRVKVAQFEMGTRSGFSDGGFRSQPSRDGVIDGEFTEVDPTARPIDSPPSGWTKNRED
jgi:UPF0716 protein FxsA